MRSQIPLKLGAKIAGRTPELLPVIAAGLLRKHLRADVDYWRGTGRASAPPSMITLRITNACNHRCSVCGQRGDLGYMTTNPGQHPMDALPADAYLSLIDEVAPHRPVINITGGEPFLYPRLLEVASHVKRRGLTLFVTTNGVRLEQCAEQIAREGWDVVLVSFDGPEAIHDACRKTPGAFQAAFRGIRALSRERKRQGTVKPYVNTSTTLSTTNVDHLVETFESGRELEPDLMVLFLSWFTSEAIGAHQTEIMRQELGIEPTSWKSYVRTFTAEQAEQFRMALVDLKAREWPFEYLIVPDVGEDNYSTYFREPSNTFGYSKCVAPFVMTDILPNGDVVTCRDFIDVRVGNIKERKLLALWNDEPYVEYRKMMIRHRGMLPQCSRCCGLMGF